MRSYLPPPQSSVNETAAATTTMPMLPNLFQTAKCKTGLVLTEIGARWLKWSGRKFTGRKVRGSNRACSASRLPLSRLGQPGSTHNALWTIKIRQPISCNTLSVPNCHATRRKHESCDTARLPKPRQGKSRGRDRVRTTDLPLSSRSEPLKLAFASKQPPKVHKKRSQGQVYSSSYIQRKRLQPSGSSDAFWTRHWQPAFGQYWVMIGCWVQILDRSDLVLMPDRQASQILGQSRAGSSSKCCGVLHTGRKPGKRSPRLSTDFPCLTIDVFGALPKSNAKVRQKDNSPNRDELIALAWSRATHASRAATSESANVVTGTSVVRIQPRHLDYSSLGLGNLAVSQLSCFLQVRRKRSDRNVRGSNPTPASRLLQSRFGQSGSISAVVLPPAELQLDIAARKRQQAHHCQSETPKTEISIKLRCHQQVSTVLSRTHVSRTAARHRSQETTAGSQLPVCCNTLPVLRCHTTQRKHKGWDTARLPKPREEKSRARGRIRTRDLAPEWRKQRGGQPLTWRRSMKEIPKRLAAVGATRLPGLGPRDPHCAWLETLQDMAANQYCFVFGFNENIRLTKTRGQRLLDEPKEGRNRLWTVKEFSATLKRTQANRRYPPNCVLMMSSHMVTKRLPPEKSTSAGILSGCPNLDGGSQRAEVGFAPQTFRRTIRVLNQSLLLKRLTARQQWLARNANALPFPRNKSPHVPTPNMEGQETVFVRPLPMDQPGMRPFELEMAQWLGFELTGRKVCGPKPNSASRISLSRLRHHGVIAGLGYSRRSFARPMRTNSANGEGFGVTSVRTHSCPAVAPFRCLATMPQEGGTRDGILSGRPNIDRESRVAEVGFEPRTFRSVNSRSNHLVHLASQTYAARWPQQLEHEFTDRKVRGSKPTSVSRLPLSRLGEPGSILTLV
ncbi:hypothetical protein T265_04473 [Opisthorchis viverrini]|uniref:Uncharacterized protein n=1 Tax=Opisthorchis viverrini TaxID=6198 RepID=A0A074ZSI0_OPIVI|nr:hypothetical protein T265_04473 [Opisthorchis viverrini]KER28782.1 hypothetical protein T265_04473 [Opisthorchis viverrini]